MLYIGSGGDIMTLVAYPMHDLANSQMGQIRKSLGEPNVSPVSYARYTGQGDDRERALLRNSITFQASKSLR